jgi:hypothetical protein
MEFAQGKALGEFAEQSVFLAFHFAASSGLGVVKALQM